VTLDEDQQCVEKLRKFALQTGNASTLTCRSRGQHARPCYDQEKVDQDM